MADYPLVFRLTHEIRCPSFSARVVTVGRALMSFEDGEWWSHGVNPGGLTECGETPGSAWAAFKGALEGIFEDLACESSSVETFKQAAHAFALETNRAQAGRWESARRQIRAGGTTVEEFFDGLQRKVDEVNPSVAVELLVKLVPEDDSLELAAAA